MSIWQEFFREPIIFLSFTGLAIVIGMCIFYAVYFYVKVAQSDSQ
ncbi:DUF3149 domain-containing protein [Aliidiomarina maris]|uniref:DUF3149 domain-containing protein n=1 Tax=Aliidiomarina maris TaxID=531312 RepID=A0A327XAV9_9GAMM|nr:DUF3149 domain-containing protein [Aliidiomarina maris]MBA3988831.1 DUF3149 domain-containing protein [Idiomarina sp.]MCL4408923.1 DUF3149 domain-containing protein [Gammaproteobacteria bacterium]MCL5049841.1 DUF3149 domain-containing protein [Bacillota bacterium]MCL5050576.1 DUF3149 domain-containing protein [Bacillota bacterium]RAK00807.1 uncharacterized protein DUF3149 [Aliidiomarina maris]